jgi:hypothetical protein
MANNVLYRAKTKFYFYEMKNWVLGFLFLCLAGTTVTAYTQQKDSTLLDLVTISPNPYYQSDQYHKYNKDTISINNLPYSTNKIDIYTLNGVLVKKFVFTQPNSSIYWNLRNEKDNTISTGLYLIHIQTPDIGDRIIKFYAVIQPTMSNF